MGDYYKKSHTVAVLRPLLFVVFMRNLASMVCSQVRLFVDGCVIYRPIHSIQEQVSLQGNLGSMGVWADIWSILFNAKKCQILSIT